MFKLEPGLIIWTSISFGILLFILYKYLLPPILQFLNEREGKITNTIEEAAKNQKRSEDLLLDSKKQLDMAREKSDEIIDRAKNEAQSFREEIIHNARAQSEIIINQARQDIDNERNKIYSEIKEEVADLVISASSKLLTKVITIEDHRKITEESLKEAINERN